MSRLLAALIVLLIVVWNNGTGFRSAPSSYRRKKLISDDTVEANFRALADGVIPGAGPLSRNRGWYNIGSSLYPTGQFLYPVALSRKEHMWTNGFI